VLGMAVPDDAVTGVLTRLGCGVQTAADGWSVTVPSFRVDLTREADLIEEVGRHWGFDRVPARFPALRAAPPAPDPGLVAEAAILEALCGAGLQEAATFTFIEREAAAPFAPPGVELVAIANPLSEKFAVLRPSLIPGLLDAVAYNRRREAEAVRLFEIGSIFAAGPEARAAGWLLAGPRRQHWSEAAAPVDVFDALGVAEVLADVCRVTLRAEAADDIGWLVPGRAARLYAGALAEPVGAAGQIAPAICAARGLAASDDVVGGVVRLDLIARAAGRADLAIAPLPRHPSVVRDLSIVVDERLPAAEVRGTIRAHAPGTLVAVREFDRYQGKGVPAGQVSLSVRLTFRDPDRTLTDHEVQQAVEAIVAALARAHGATLRGATTPGPQG
jgi:phenylalanyl-tRNA synthetase beta chain